MSARIAAVVGSLLLGGCYWSSPPDVPHRNVKFDVAETRAIEAPAPPALAGTKVVVLGRFDTVAANPIGGLYDRQKYSVSPLIRTYFFRDGAVEIFEHVSDGLRAAGLVVLKDYAGAASPALVEAPLRSRDPILVSATVLALQHDQIREKGAGQDWEVGRVEIDLRVTDPRGAALLSKKYLVDGRIPHGNGDFLKLLGWKLAEQLTRDPEFVRAVGATAIGGAR
jgi:hypothetical protein